MYIFVFLFLRLYVKKPCTYTVIVLQVLMQKILSVLLEFQKCQHRVTVKPTKANPFPSSDLFCPHSYERWSAQSNLYLFLPKKMFKVLEMCQSHASFFYQTDFVVSKPRHSCFFSFSCFFFLFFRKNIYFSYLFLILQLMICLLDSSVEDKNDTYSHLSHMSHCHIKICIK